MAIIQTKTKTVKKPLVGRPLGPGIGAYGDMERKAKAGDPQAQADLKLEKSRYKEFADGPGSGPSGGWPTPKKKMGGTVKKKMQMGGKMSKPKELPTPAPKPMVGIKKAKSGGSFGMLSVKAGIDKNPKATAADRIAGAKKKNKAQMGAAVTSAPIMKKGGMMKKCKYGCK